MNAASRRRWQPRPPLQTAFRCYGIIMGNGVKNPSGFNRAFTGFIQLICFWLLGFMPFFKKLYQKNRNKKTQRENQSVFYFYGCRIHQSGCILSKTKTPSRTFCVRDGVVPVVGVEPTRCCHQRILSPSRLPIPTHRQFILPLYYITLFKECQHFFEFF